MQDSLLSCAAFCQEGANLDETLTVPRLQKRRLNIACFVSSHYDAGLLVSKRAAQRACYKDISHAWAATWQSSARMLQKPDSLSLSLSVCAASGKVLAKMFPRLSQRALQRGLWYRGGENHLVDEGASVDMAGSLSSEMILSLCARSVQLQKLSGFRLPL